MAERARRDERPPLPPAFDELVRQGRIHLPIAPRRVIEPCPTVPLRPGLTVAELLGRDEDGS